jgi:membrane protein DedA with SNARE-associated domain
MLEQIHHWMQVPQAVFWVCAATGLVIPLPEDIVMLYLGIVVKDEGLAWWPMMLAAAFGALLRDIIMYFVGRGLGDWIFSDTRVLRLFGVKRLEKARNLFLKRGTEAVIMGRFMVGARVAFFAVAGAMRTPFRTFLVWDFLGTLVSTPILMLLGAWLGHPFLNFMHWTIARTGPGLWIVVGVLGFVWWWVARKRNPDGDDDASATVSERDI